jgi:hypothetical protein
MASTLGGFSIAHLPNPLGAKLKFIKPFLTFDQQAELLIQRGLQGDKAKIIEHLESVLSRM